jgi:hypothetical protein
MQIYKVIPSNPNIVQVRNTLAVYGGLTVDTRDLGTLCAKAKSGGSGGYAFSIAENGGAVFADALDSYEIGRHELDGFYVNCSQVETYLSNDGLHGYTNSS